MGHDLNSGEERDREEQFFYLASLPMNKYFPMLCDDVIVPDVPKSQKKSGNLWIGNQGQITPIHYDYSTGDPGQNVHYRPPCNIPLSLLV